MAINPNFHAPEREHWNVPALAEGIRRGDRSALARGITLIESDLSTDQGAAAELLTKLQPEPSDQPSSFRLGITGNPGAGKSTLIEALGTHWSEAGHRVAVLAIDPSSSQHHGSILGDKTRMEMLGKATGAFIRPSPSAGALGGIHSQTSEVIQLFEAAGFSRIVIETVGVGQNETAIQGVVDFTLLVALPGAGDEVQGLKRGVMEAADLIWVNKADGAHKAAAEQAAGQLRQALGLFNRADDQHVEVLVGSALDQASLTPLWDALDRGLRWGWASDRTVERRRAQKRTHMTRRIQAGLWSEALDQGQSVLAELEEKVANGELSPTEGALEFLRHLSAKHR